MNSFEYTTTLYGIEMNVHCDYEWVVDPSYGDNVVLDITDLYAENSAGQLVDLYELMVSSPYGPVKLYEIVMEDAKERMKEYV